MVIYFLNFHTVSDNSKEKTDFLHYHAACRKGYGCWKLFKIMLDGMMS